jgi:acetolactate synthase-1/2/3 large subunit
MQAADAARGALSGAEAVVRMLQAHGVTHVFGLCGDTSLPLYDAFARLDHGITHVLCRDERSAAYMADGYARVSGRVGVCEGPSGGGATYILPGLVEANESSVPILAITTDISVAARGRFALTELDQRSLFRPVTKWNEVADRAADIPRLLRTAFAQMTTGRPGSAQLTLPLDVQQETVDAAELWADPSLGRYPSRRVAPDPEAVAQAADALARAERPLLICGGGVVTAGAERELATLAERLGAAIATTISGQGSISDEHALAVGVIGSNGGTPQTRALVDRADLIFFIGCRAGSVTTERWRHPSIAGGAPQRAGVRIVHLDIDPLVIGANYPTEVALVGDALLGLRALLDALVETGVPATPVVEEIHRLKAEKFAAFRELARSDARPIRPERVIDELQGTLPPDAIVVADPGTPCPYVAAYFAQRVTGRHLISNRAHGALGYALAAAAGAQFARPSATCVALMGDGSFGFTAGELETIARFGLPLTCVVFSNAEYGWIKAGQKSAFDERYFSVDFGRTDHARIAEAYGLRAWRIEDPRALREALAEAIAFDGPALVDVVTQPLEEARAPVSEWIA